MMTDVKLCLVLNEDKMIKKEDISFQNSKKYEESNRKVNKNKCYGDSVSPDSGIESDRFSMDRQYLST